MRRTGRRFSEDFLEENEEITYEDYEAPAPEETEFEEYYDLSDLSESDGEAPAEPEEKSSSALKKIGKILIIILVLIALFFASAKITEIILDHNEEPATYGNDAPDMDEDFDEIIDEEYEETPDTNIPAVLGGEDDGADYMPEPSATPAPSASPAPSEAPKPAIKPGNPAA